jgi:hypothetical protein
MGYLNKVFREEDCLEILTKRQSISEEEVKD